VIFFFFALQRYLHYSTLIHRPSIEVVRQASASLDASSSCNISTQLTLASARACVASCKELIDLADANRMSSDRRGWWWYDITGE